MQRLFITVLLVCPVLVWAAAPVYKQVDEQGNVTFTDQPAPDAEKVDMQATNIAPPPADNYPRATTPPAVTAGAVNYAVAITAPGNDAVISRGPGNFSVSASVTPPLRATAQLQLLMDGATEGEPQKHAAWALTNVFRGAHNLQVVVVDDKGGQLAKSEPVTVYVFRPSSNF